MYPPSLLCASTMLRMHAQSKQVLCLNFNMGTNELAQFEINNHGNLAYKINVIQYWSSGKCK